MPEYYNTYTSLDTDSNDSSLTLNGSDLLTISTEQPSITTDEWYDDVDFPTITPSTSHSDIVIEEQDLMDNEITSVDNLSKFFSVISFPIEISDASITTTTDSSVTIDTSVNTYHVLISNCSSTTNVLEVTTNIINDGDCMHLALYDTNCTIKKYRIKYKYAGGSSTKTFVCPLPNGTVLSIYETVADAGVVDTSINPISVIKWGTLPNDTSVISCSSTSMNLPFCPGHSMIDVKFDDSIGILDYIDASPNFKFSLYPNQSVRFNRTLRCKKTTSNGNITYNSSIGIINAPDPVTGEEQVYILRSNISQNVIYTYDDFIFSYSTSENIYIAVLK